MPKDETAPLPAPARRRATPALTPRERAYVMLAIHVRVQHLQLDAAAALVEAMLALGEDGPDLRLARAVVAFRQGRHAEVLDELRRLDRIDPPDGTAGARAGERSRIRSFMKARSCYVLNGALDEEGCASLDFYLRRKGAGPTGGAAA